MVEGGSLENCCAERYRGFKSYFLRQIIFVGHRLILACDLLYLGLGLVKGRLGGISRTGIDMAAIVYLPYTEIDANISLRGVNRALLEPIP